MCSEILFDSGVDKAKADLDLMTFDECCDYYLKYGYKLDNEFSKGYLLTLIANDGSGDFDVQR